jgi:NAD(P)-dependent dehydrogenase (short-subunit alcohol dehydrogenase family)
MSSPLPFSGKTIWITGGAGYLGTPITLALDAAGARVVCIDLQGRAEALVRDRQLTRTTGLSFDCSDAAALPAFLDATMAAHGVPDGVAHLAFASSAGKRLEQLLPAEFQRTFDLALTPTFVLCRALAERMKARGSGSLVLFSSMYGLVSPDPRIYVDQLTPNPIDYGASKAAVLQMARYLAVHYGASGIRFNCVTPGPFPNPAVQAANPVFLGELNRKTALNRVGRNEEIVGPTLFLLGDASSYVTGHSLVVDGGWTAW